MKCYINNYEKFLNNYNFKSNEYLNFKKLWLEKNNKIFNELYSDMMKNGRNSFDKNLEIEEIIKETFYLKKYYE